MTRFIAVCLFGAGACVAAMVLLGQALWSPMTQGTAMGTLRSGSRTVIAPVKPHAEVDNSPASGVPKPEAVSVDDDKPVVRSWKWRRRAAARGR